MWVTISGTFSRKWISETLNQPNYWTEKHDSAVAAWCSQTRPRIITHSNVPVNCIQWVLDCCSNCHHNGPSHNTGLNINNYQWNDIKAGTWTPFIHLWNGRWPLWSQIYMHLSTIESLHRSAITTANQMLDCSLCYIFSGYMPSNQVFMDCMQRFAKCTSCHVQHWINVQSNPSRQFFEFEMKANHIDTES